MSGPAVLRQDENELKGLCRVMIRQQGNVACGETF